jgi:hypothetical protein
MKKVCLTLALIPWFYNRAQATALYSGILFDGFNDESGNILIVHKK